MKNTIGIIILLFISHSVFAEDAQMNNAEAAMPETKTTAATSESTEASAPVKMAKEQSGFSKGSVVRSAFTTEITDREPMENLQKLTNENGQVMFFTELRDMSGQIAVHRWEYDGKIMAEIEFNVKGPRWRVWSSKSLIPQWTGEWKVSVINGAGEVISEKNLSYEVAAAATTTDSKATTSMPAENSTSASGESAQ